MAIRLTSERLGHILEHPEMAGMENAISETLKNPERVVESVSDPLAHLYYRHYAGTRVGDKYLCVVVMVRQTDAFILTAYLTDKPKKGAPIWPRSA
jgi:molybdopterin synthase catalytic subunit